MTSGLTTQGPFLVCLQLNPEIWKEIQIKANDQRVEGNGIELEPPVSKISTYRAS
jgi:hypothetical protein